MKLRAPSPSKALDRRSKSSSSVSASRTRRPQTKYRNVKTVVDGVTFDSQREAGEWVKLTAMARKGAIQDLQRQVPFDLVVNGVKVCRYVADFVWTERCDCPEHGESGRRVVADAKGMRTREYALKAKLMRAIHGVTILEL